MTCDEGWLVLSAKVAYRLTHPSARCPTRATAGSVGYDVYACDDVRIEPGKSAVIKTGIALALPEPCDGMAMECQVRGRSGLAFIDDVVTHVGTIDSDYRGEIGVKLWNLGDEAKVIRAGDRVAQLVFALVSIVTLEEVAELPATERGTGGFGSTGA